MCEEKEKSFLRPDSSRKFPSHGTDILAENGAYTIRYDNEEGSTVKKIVDSLSKIGPLGHVYTDCLGMHFPQCNALRI